MLDMEIPMGAKWVNIATGKLMERAEGGGWKEISPPEINFDGCTTQEQAERSVAWLDAHNEWVKRTTR